MSDLSNATPEGWIVAPLQEVVTLRSERVNPQSMPDMPYIGMEHVEPHTNRIIRTVPASSVTSSAARFCANDVLYGRMRPYLNKVAQPRFAGLASGEFMVFAFSALLNPTFLQLRLTSADFVEFALSQISGDRPRVKFEQLSDFAFALPPLREQHRIVEKLEELLGDLDAGVAELRAAQVKLKLYRQSLLKAAVTGELTAEWRVGYSRALGPTYELESSAAPDLPTLPHGWHWSSVGQIGAIQGGIQKQPSRAPVLNRYPFLRVANVARDELRLDEIHEIELFEGELERVALSPGDVLIVEGNGSRTEIGRCAVWSGEIANAVHQNHLIRVRPTGVRPRFLAAWLNSPMGIGRMAALAATTSGLYTLSVSKIARIPVPVPPLDEQDQIVELLVNGKEILHEQVAAISHALRQSEAQRKNILQAAFSGQLVPQDLNDEPASVLLERIRASRAGRATAPTRRPRKAREPA